MAWVIKKDKNHPIWQLSKESRNSKRRAGPWLPEVKKKRPPKPRAKAGYKYVWKEK